MDPIRFSIQNPVKIAVGVLLLILFGLIALATIPIQLVPNVDQTIITVTTQWTGRSPEEVEREIVEPQEDVLKNLRNLEKMTATANQGQAEISLEFAIGTDLNAARQEVSDSLREVPEYPDEADEPTISSGSSGEGEPVAWLLLTSDDPTFDVQSLGRPAEEQIKPYLERVPGVSEVRVYGGREREVHLRIDPEQLAQRGITFNQLRQALQLRNVNVSAGTVTEGRYDVRVRTIGQYDDLEQVRNTVLAYDDGGPVRIKDVGTVDLGLEKRRSFVRSRGEIALALPVYRESGANVISIMEELRGRLEQVNENVLPLVAAEAAELNGLASPPSLSLDQVYDETGYIYDALGLVQSNLFIGGVLAIVALLLFLELGRRPLLVVIGSPILLVLMVLTQTLPAGPPQLTAIGLLAAAVPVILLIARPTGVVALAIPISIIGTFVVLAALGRNLNVISLAGLAFAVGMVVDNAIVVIENIDRHIAMHKKPLQAAFDAAREVWGAILASTLTTLAVFVPVLTVEEEAGQLFRDIALAICAAVSLSLIVSITVIPAASSRFLRERKENTSITGAVGRGVMKFFGAINTGYANLVYGLMAPNVLGVTARILIVALLTVASIGGAAALMLPADYLPRGNKNLVFGFLLTPPGYNIAFDEEGIGERVESVLRPYWEGKTPDEVRELLAAEGREPLVHPFTGQPIDVVPIDNFFFVSFLGNKFNGATSADKLNVAPVADLMTAAANSVPGAIGFAQQQSIFGRGIGGSRGIDVEVLGSDLDEVRGAAGAIFGMLAGQYGPTSVRPTPMNFDKGAREVQLRIDPVKAADLGIDVAALGGGVSALVDGLYVGDFRFRGEMIDIKAMPPADQQLTGPDELLQTPLAYVTGDGQTGVIPLSEVTENRRDEAPQSIQRIEEQRAITLSVVPPDTVPLEAATEQIHQAVAGMRAQGVVPPSVQVNLSGSASSLTEVREALLGSWHGWTLQSLASLGLSRIFLALLVVYLLMAALFESFLYPLVIMFSVPLATVGGFIGLRLITLIQPAQQLDTLTMLGFIILIGVVVNNAILLVHQSLNFMRGLGEGEGDNTGAMPARDAIRESVRTRIRPILMTTTTSVAGMLPLVLMPGSGSELYRGLGSVVVGGLIVATMFTLIIVPLLFSLVLDLKRAIVGVAEQPMEQLAPAPA